MLDPFGRIKVVLPDSSEEAGEAPRVLVAEDDSVNQRVAALILEKLGYRAYVVGDGIEALEALAQRDYSVVLMDCQMPAMDGYRATELLREYEGRARHTPVIAMTAAAMPGDRERCLASGMDDYLTKPIIKADLESLLARWTGALQRNAANPFGGE